jgi:ubiquinone/menaquinone biosynthesis C-methylase UbiE
MFDFDKSEINLVYEKARAIPDNMPEVLRKMFHDLPSKHTIKTILDLGCGTGRFTKELSDYFSAKVYGIDPSKKMLSVAKASIISSHIEFIIGSADQIPLPSNSADMVFISQVYHHIEDKNKAIHEIKRVLKKNGFFCMRYSPLETLDSYIYPGFFPSAKEIDAKRLPTRNDINKIFTKNGFQQISQKIIIQLFAGSHTEYYRKIKMRGTSDLSAISDKEFFEGLESLKKYCCGHKNKEPVYENVDFIIFSL